MEWWKAASCVYCSWITHMVWFFFPFMHKSWTIFICSFPVYYRRTNLSVLDKKSTLVHQPLSCFVTWDSCQVLPCLRGYFRSVVPPSEAGGDFHRNHLAEPKSLCFFLFHISKGNLILDASETWRRQLNFGLRKRKAVIYGSQIKLKPDWTRV